MTLTKTELRSAGMSEVGNKLDDVLEATKHELHRAEGGQASVQVSMERVLQLTTTVNKEVDDGVLSIDDAKLVKTWLVKVQMLLKGQAAENDNRMMVSKGVVLGVDRAVKVAKTMYDLEMAKAMPADEQHGSAVAPGGGVSAVPKMSIKERRLAEEKAQAPTEEPVDASTKGTKTAGSMKTMSKALKTRATKKRTTKKKPAQK